MKKGKNVSLPKNLNQYGELAKASYDNAALWIADAKLLIDKKSFGHSVALAHFAREEIAKALVCWYVSQDIWPIEDNKMLKDAFSSHSMKNELIVGNMVGTYVYNYLISLKKARKTEISETMKKDLLKLFEVMKKDDWTREMEEDRQRSIYVDFHSGRMITPRQIDKERAIQEYDLAKALFMDIKQFLNADEQAKERLRRYFKSLPKELWNADRLTEELLEKIKNNEKRSS